MPQKSQFLNSTSKRQCYAHQKKLFKPSFHSSSIILIASDLLSRHIDTHPYDQNHLDLFAISSYQVVF